MAPDFDPVPLLSLLLLSLLLLSLLLFSLHIFFAVSFFSTSKNIIEEYFYNLFSKVRDSYLKRLVAPIEG